MKKAVCFLCSMLLLTGCSSPATPIQNPDKPQEISNPKVAAPADITYPRSPSIEDYDAQIAIEEKNPVDVTMLNGYTDFSQESFAAILQDTSGNVSYSPLSLYYPLMLTLQASQGTTADQLKTLLHVPQTDNAENMGNLYRRLYVDNESGQLKIANSLWVQKDYPIKKEFTQTANKQFYASAYTADFSQTETADLMAAWIREHTNGNLAPSIQTDETMRIAILNAIYYKARFESEFDKKNTKRDTFYAEDGNVTVDFMHKEMSTHFFIDNKDYSATSLALSNSSTLTLVLPKENSDVHKLMNSSGFLQELFQDDADGAEFGTVKLSLPKFKVHTKLRLADTLKSLGAASLFDSSAQLDGISDEHPLYISDVQQETSIDLNEEGVEASAFTMIGVVGAGFVEHPKVLDLNLNRTFLYVITTRINGVELPLFIGTCANPAA